MFKSRLNVACDTTEYGVLSPTVWYVALYISPPVMRGIHAALICKD